MKKPNILDVIPLVRKVYEQHCAGCCLHIVTDDDNYEQGHADFILKDALERGHPDCIKAAEAIVRLSNTQRHKLHMRYSEYCS